MLPPMLSLLFILLPLFRTFLILIIMAKVGYRGGGGGRTGASPRKCCRYDPRNLVAAAYSTKEVSSVVMLEGSVGGDDVD